MVSNKHKLILLTPPKTASNSIIRSLEEIGVVFNTPLKNVVHPLTHLTLDEIIDLYDIQNIDEYRVIQFVRNPFDRFISAYIHQIEIMGREDISLREIIEKVETYKDISKTNIDKFYEEFYGGLIYKQIKFHNKNWGGLRFWWEQNWWNESKKEIKIFKFEEITKDIKPLSEYINIELVGLKNIRPNMGEKNIVNYESFKNEFGKKIYDMYINDFKLYEYEL